jgi:hypothetical protein
MEEMLQPIPTKFSFLEKCLSANFSENFASDFTNLINVTQVSVLSPKTETANMAETGRVQFCL